MILIYTYSTCDERNEKSKNSKHNHLFKHFYAVYSSSRKFDSSLAGSNYSVYDIKAMCRFGFKTFIILLVSKVMRIMTISMKLST